MPQLGISAEHSRSREPARVGLEPRQAETAPPVILGHYVRAAEEK